MAPFLYLLFVIVLIIVLFVIVRRPMYEVMTVAFLSVALFAGLLDRLPGFFWDSARNSILYTALAFMLFSLVLDKTGIMQDFINIILALVGKLPGGAGYVAIAASAIMGSLSGNSPGNAASVGPITLPAMEKSGFPPELAAAVVCASSALGPIIPPSATIPTVYAILCTAFPGACTFSQYWVFMWGISLWFILQRVIALFIRVKQYHIGPIAREHRPRLRDALRSGWKAVFLPVVVLFPFLFDNLASGTLITARLGAEGAAAFTSALLATVPSLAVLYVLIIAKNQIRLRDFGKIFRDNIPEIAPIVILILAGFILGSVFADTGISDALNQMIQVNGIPFWAVCTVLPLVITVLGMFLEPMSIILLFGSTVITLGASVGINPILMSGVLVVLTHGMGQMTPPFALTFYIPVVMARANLRKSIKEIVFWCALQYLFVVLVLFGVLPVLGLVPFAA